MPVCGTVRCNACRKQMTSIQCKCGNPTAHIDLYWQGDHLRFGKYYLDGEVLDFKRAMNQLFEMRMAIKKGTFTPSLWTHENFKAAKFEIQLDKWLEQKREEREAGEFAPSTLKSYQGYARNHYTYFDGVDVRQIKHEHLEDFKDHLATKPGLAKIKTRRNILNALHAFFNWMHRRGTIEAVPVWPILKGDNSDIRTAIDLDEQERGIKNLPEIHRDIFAFEFETGLRPGEVCALKVGDIDLINGVALIQRTYSGTALKETTKANAKKPIPLSGKAFALAKKHARSKHPESFLFINQRTGRGYLPEVLRRAWRTHSQVPVTHYEASRHSFCTQLVESGALDSEAQALMRHSDPRSTRQYTHLRPHRLKNVLERRGKAQIIPLKATAKQRKKTGKAPK